MDNRHVQQDVWQRAGAVLCGHVSFEEIADSLTALLQELPLVKPQTVTACYDLERASRVNLEDALAFIQQRWAAAPHPGSHEGAVAAEVLELPDVPGVLCISFSAYVWGNTSEISRVSLARIQTNSFLALNALPPRPVRSRRCLPSLWLNWLKRGLRSSGNPQDG